jgi:hypothetical protein
MAKQALCSEGTIFGWRSVNYSYLINHDRFNLDKPKGLLFFSCRDTKRILLLVADVYESELERMNASMTADNHALQRDNKQLNALIKEYEQTLENVMSAFRNRAVRVSNSTRSTVRF